MSAVELVSRDPSCIHPGARKYFLRPCAADTAWRALAELAEPRVEPVTCTRTIETPELLIRSGPSGTPLVVIPKRRWTPESTERLHALLGYQPDAEV